MYLLATVRLKPRHSSSGGRLHGDRFPFVVEVENPPSTPGENQEPSALNSGLTEMFPTWWPPWLTLYSSWTMKAT